MSKNDFIIGATVRISSVIVALPNNNPVDPGGLVLKIRSPDQALSTLVYGTDVGLVKDSEGNYHADIMLGQFGTWHWRWEAANPHSGVIEGELTVKASKVL